MRQIAFLLLLFLLSAPAEASPPFQFSGVAVGGGGLTRANTNEFKGMGFLGLRGDLALFRNSPRAVGIGPYLEGMSVAFRSLEFGGGLQGTFPLGGPVLALSIGPHSRWIKEGSSLGVSSSLFLGARSYNYNSHYGYSLGGFVQGRWSLQDNSQRDLLFGLQVDLEILALPLLFGISATRHGVP